MLTVAVCFSLIVSTLAVRVQTPAAVAPACGVCMSVVGQAAELNAAHLSTAEMQDVFYESICPGFAQFEAECRAIANEHLAAVIAALDAGRGVQQVCRSLTLCASTAAEAELLAVEPAKPQSGFCSICEAVVGFAESYVEQNKTEAEIEQRLDQACEITGPYETECKNLVHEYLPTIIEYLKDHQPPDVVCKELHVCPSTLLRALRLVKPKPVEPQSGFCSICEAVVGFAESYVEQNKTEAEIAHKLEELCSITGPYETECKNLIEVYLPSIISYLKNDQKPDVVCREIGVCSSAGLKNALLRLVKPVGKPVAKPAAPQSGFCSICQAIVGFAESYVEQNHTEAEIEHELDNACALTGPYEAECKNLVHAYLPALIHYIHTHQDPKTFCTEIGVCSSALVVAKPPKAPQSGFCSICKAVVGFIESYVEQNKTEAEIEHELDTACSLTGPYETECKNLVHAYLPALINYVKEKETPTKACTQIGVCSSALAPLAAALEKKRAVRANEHCGLCKTLVGYAGLYLQHDENVMAIERQLDKLCDLAGDWKASCVTFVEAQTPVILSDLAKRETPERICAQIHQCADMPPPPIHRARAVESSHHCPLCKTLVGYVELFVGRNETVQQIEHRLDEVCELFGGFKEQCITLVNAETPTILHDVLEKETPEQICEKIHQCDAPPPPPPPPVVKRAVESAHHCGLCKTLVGYCELFVGRNETVQQIEERLDQVCDLFGNFKDMCVTLVNTETPTILHDLLEKETPEKICEKIHQCDAPPMPLLAIEPAPGASAESCVVCELLVAVSEHFIEENGTNEEAALEAELKRLCKQFAGGYASECSAFVDTFVKDAAKYAAQHANPATLCKDTTLCAKK